MQIQIYPRYLCDNALSWVWASYKNNLVKLERYIMPFNADDDAGACVLICTWGTFLGPIIMFIYGLVVFTQNNGDETAKILLILGPIFLFVWIVVYCVYCAGKH